MPRTVDITRRNILQALVALRERCVEDVRKRIAECKATGAHRALQTDDDAEDVQETAVALAIAALRDADARAVDRAIEKVYAGTYGRCEDCESQIPRQRLAAQPFAAYCVPCQTVRETVSPRARRFPTGLRTQREYS